MTPVASDPLHLYLSYGLPRRGLPAAASFRYWVTAALVTVAFHNPAELCVRLVDSEEGRALNARYRGKDCPTNVLSFPAELPVPIPVPPLGDLVLCAPLVADEAAAQGKPLKHHYAHLTIHGVLHLLGYDHLQAAPAERMEALERQILAGLGIPDPYR